MLVLILASMQPPRGRHPVGKSENHPLQLFFNRLLHAACQESPVTSDGGSRMILRRDNVEFGNSIQEESVTNRYRRQIAYSVAFLLALGLRLFAFGDNDASQEGERHLAQTAKDVAFDTGTLKGSFHFLDRRGQEDRTFHSADRPGVGKCVYKPLGMSLVNVMPANALFMPEWIMTPKGYSGILWERAFFIEPEPIPSGVRVRYPDKDLAGGGLRCALEYRAIADMLLLDGYIKTTHLQEDLELIFASYISDKLSTTYIPRQINGRISWQSIPIRDRSIITSLTAGMPP